jgi:hypothetical protein
MRKTGKRTDPNAPPETRVSSLVEAISKFEIPAGSDSETLRDAAYATAAMLAESDQAMSLATAKACSLMLGHATSRSAAAQTSTEPHPLILCRASCSCSGEFSILWHDQRPRGASPLS